MIVRPAVQVARLPERISAHAALSPRSCAMIWYHRVDAYTLAAMVFLGWLSETLKRSRQHMQIIGWAILIACFGLVYYLICARQRDKNRKDSKSSATDDNEYRGPPISMPPNV